MPCVMEADAMADTRDFAADVARYDAWYRTPWGAWADEREQQMLTALARPRAGERALDVGAGTGRLLNRLLAMGLDAWGVEPAPDMRGAAQWRVRGAGHDPARIIGARGEALPFADRSFDLVTAVTVLEFVDRPRDVLREMARTSRGRVFVGALNGASAYGEQIARGEMGNTLARARLFGVDELLALVREHVRPCSLTWRTALLGPRTDDPRELAAQRRLEAEPGADRRPSGAYIAVLAEVSDDRGSA